jgi:hypothetical protein
MSNRRESGDDDEAQRPAKHGEHHKEELLTWFELVEFWVVEEVDELFLQIEHWQEAIERSHQSTR